MSNGQQFLIVKNILMSGWVKILIKCSLLCRGSESKTRDFRAIRYLGEDHKHDVQQWRIFTATSDSPCFDTRGTKQSMYHGVHFHFPRLSFSSDMYIFFVF